MSSQTRHLEPDQRSGRNAEANSATRKSEPGRKTAEVAPPFSNLDDRWRFHDPAAGPASPALPSGRFSDEGWLSADFYNPHSVILQIKLQFLPTDAGRAGHIIFGLYPQVRARLRVPGHALALNAWLLPREGALLKPMCGGDVVRPNDVRSLRLTLLAGPEENSGWWQTEWQLTDLEPAKLEQAESLHRPILDDLGQSAVTTWPNKTLREEEMVARLQAEADSSSAPNFPGDWSAWGGSLRHTFPGTGFFRTHHDGKRWWLVDPDGGAFWSTGLCCVTPMVEAAISGMEHLLSWQPDNTSIWADAWRIRREGVDCGIGINFLAANFIRAFGPDKWRHAWRKLAVRFLRRRRFNTIGNWSDWEIGKGAALPYTRPLRNMESLPIPQIFRDFPDVFHPDFSKACAEWAEQLRATRDDPAFLGYFICNEPTWSVAKQPPAAGMLVNTTEAHTRAVFARWLEERHGALPLESVWHCPGANPSRIRSGSWDDLPDTPAFRQDAETFSAVMVSRLFDTLGAACKRVDPHHLNLGARFANPPEEWMRDCFASFDVFSFNSYSKKPRPAGAEISRHLNRPILIGEWHFGATDTGFPAAALESVASQSDRALAYRRYLEAHAAEPWCVGVHWFTLYDQSALGRYDGEPYNCGFLDVCHHEQTDIAEAAQASHERLYEIVSGQIPPTLLPAPRHTRRLSL